MGEYMTEKLTRLIVDLETGETSEIELTAEEITQYQSGQAAAEERLAQEALAQQEKESIKQTIKNKLASGQPLTPEEADLLLP